MNKATVPSEGDLYKIINIDNVSFRIIYGYYEESERGKVEPLPVFPDLKSNPVYTADGKRIVTAIQEPCKFYIPKNKNRIEDWCGDCISFLDANKEISICGCTERMLE